MADGDARGRPTAGWAPGALGAVQRADREIARQTAVRARAVAAFAASRPASADRPAGAPGAMSDQRRAARPAVLASVSEWAAPELVLALEISNEAAVTLLERSLTLVHRLPRTLAALESGALHTGHLFPLLERVGPIADDAKRAEVEAKLLAWMSGRVTTPAQLADKARRLGLLVDARDSARRLVEAVRRRGVHVRPDRDDGMAQAVALLTVPEAAALVDALGRYADALDEPGDERTRNQKMADCLLDLVLRPGETDLAPVQAQLTVVAAVSTLLGGDQPGEIAGHVVPAELVRALARALGLLPAEDAAVQEETAALDDDRPDVDETAALDRDRPDASDPSDDVAPAEDVAPRGKPSPRGGPSRRDEPPPPDDAPPASAGVPPPNASAGVPPPNASAVERALDAWWRDVERRALIEQWGAARPVIEYQPAHHAGRRRPLAAAPRTGPSPTRGPSLASEPSPPLEPAMNAAPPTTGPSPTDQPAWAAADEAVTAAGQAQRGFDRALARAGEAVRRAERADATDEGAWQRSSAGRASAADDTLGALREAGEEQRAALARLLEATAGGGLAERPRIAVVDALTGALQVLTDSRELRQVGTCDRPACRRRPGGCTHDLGNRPGLGPPPPTAGYTPGAALDRYLRARDRRCRQPGCRRPVPRGGELDHDRPWPAGPTSAGNLVGYCTSHHRGKHQALGWRHALATDGTLTVTTPSGLRATSTPPPF